MASASISAAGTASTAAGATLADQEVGTFCLVLHSHLPWLANHGSWPVGEEWLYQSWAHSYLPVLDLLDRLSHEGYRDLVTLGITPILAAQLDDPHCLTEFQTWLGFWQHRAHELATSPGADSEIGQYEYSQALWSVEQFNTRWAAGGSTPLRKLRDAGVIELLGGPAAHPFQPLLNDQVASFSLEAGLDDSRIRFGHNPAGIWAPECGYRPGLEELYQAAGVTHFMVDGPTLLGAGRTTADAWTVADSDVVAFGRDLEVTYRVWSPRKGYPSGQWYRDFHTYHHQTGIKHKRVTSVQTESEHKSHYEPEHGRRATLADAHDFVRVVVERLKSLKQERNGKAGLVVAGYDTELFGHWWHEGPIWLEHVLRLLPEAGVNVTTLTGAIAQGAVAGNVNPSNSSWGSNKDWSVWAGPAVEDLVHDNDTLQTRWLKALTHVANRQNELLTRSPLLDQLARHGLLALQSDWAFMVSKDSAAHYARSRHSQHHEQFNRVLTAIEKTNSLTEATALVGPLPDSRDYPFGNLDGRRLVCGS